MVKINGKIADLDGGTSKTKKKKKKKKNESNMPIVRP